MKQRALKILLFALIGCSAMPALAHRDEDGWHNHRHREHRHHHDRYPPRYAGPGCWIEGAYDRAGYYRERQVCREARVALPLLPPPAVLFQPPSVVIQAPGIYVR